MFGALESAFRGTSLNRKQVLNKDDIGEKIMQLTERLLQARGDNATFEPEHSILIELESNDSPDLTIIDLPGIVRTAVTGQDASVIQDVDGLLSRYMQQDRTLMLAVIPSNVDIATVDIIERASKEDPEGKRTVGVLTKPDMIGEGAHKPVLDTLLNVTKPLKLGYTMVKNRSQREIDNNLTIEEAKGCEVRFFRNHDAFGPVMQSNPELFGVPNLTAKLVTILLNRIQETLPQMVVEVNSLIKQTRLALERLGHSVPDDDAGKRNEFVRVVQAITSDLKMSLDGNYSSPVFDKDKKLRVIARIKADVEPPFQAEVHNLKPKWEQAQIIKEISAMRGRELPGFPKFEAFTHFVRVYVHAWNEPMMQVLERMVGIVQEAAQGLIEHYASVSCRLVARLTQVFQSIIDSRFEAARTAQLVNLIENESVPTTLNHYYMDTYNKIKVDDFQKELNEIWASSQVSYASATGSVNAVPRQTAHVKLLAWYERSLCLGQSNEVQDAADMILLLDAYWKTSAKRFIDSVCQVTDRVIIRGLADEFLAECMKLLVTPEIIDMLQEDIKTKETRKHLENKLNRLMRAQEMLQHVQ